MKPGDLASIVVTFVDDRDGRALVRLPNGSKTRVEHDELNPLAGNGHVTQSTKVGRGVDVFCHECPWTGNFPGGHQAQAALAGHEHVELRV
jgi:hypothetical protein